MLSPGDQIITAKGQVLEVEELVLDGRRVRTWKNVGLLVCYYPALLFYENHTLCSCPSHWV